jgi:uncharacterized protein YkwD
MKSTILLSVLLFFSAHCFCQQWTADQLEEANTAGDIEYLSSQEKQLIQYINLCRLYPKQFAANEVKLYSGIPGVNDRNMAKYKASLIRDLNQRQPCEALDFDETLYDDAHCYATELSAHKRTPHQRIDCDKSNYAECIFFGSEAGRNIAIEWLIDSGISKLGHRKNCLNPAYKKTGVKITTHFQYGHCSVGEFTW